MAKRFTDTDKWKKPFIRGLEGAYKLLWFYILDDCDHAGIWQVDFEVAQIRIGHPVSEKKAIEVFGERIVKIAANKWWIPDFVSFQYGELSDKNRLHISVIQILTKYKIETLAPYKPLTGAQGQEQGIGNGQGNGQGTIEHSQKIERDFNWYKSQIDAIWSDQLPTEKKQNLGRALEESWLHLSANKFELVTIDGAGCKRLVNSWLSKMKPENGKHIYSNRLDLTKI